MSKKKQLLIALVVGAIALLGNQMYINSRIGQFQNKKYATVVRAKKAIRAGTTLSVGLIDSAKVPEEFVPRAKIDWASKDQFLGQELAVDVLNGDYILETSFATHGSVGRTLSQQLEGEDFRAITIPVDDTTSFARSLVAGDRIDILYSFSMPFLKQKLTTVLLQNVPIISTGGYSAAQQEMGERGRTAKYSSITLKVTAQDAMRLTYARQAGSIQLLLRSLRDSKAVEIPAITGIQDVLSPADRAMVETMLKEERQKFEVPPQQMEQLRDQARLALDQQKRQLQALGVKTDKDK